MQIGFLTYDLQPFTEDCLYRISEQIKPSKLRAYPIIVHQSQQEARISYLPSRHKGKHLGVNRRGNTPEGLMSNVNWQAAWNCVLESDIVVLFGLQGGTALVAAFLALIMHRKIISVNQTLPVAWEVKRKWWIRRLKGWLLNRCEFHVYQTPASKEVLMQVYHVKNERLFYAPFEAGASWFKLHLDKSCNRRDTVRHGLGINKDTTLFLFVGNLVPFKGISDLIEALSILPKDKNFFCIFVGPEEPSHKTGGTIKYFTELAMRHGVQERVRFLGPLGPADLAEIYWAADAVLLPTHKDCFPKVLVEGALAGKPLVTTDACGAIGTMVIDGVNGFVVKAGDVQGLSKTIRQLLDKDLRKKMGECSLELVNNFCNEKVETQGYVSAIKATLQ